MKNILLILFIISLFSITNTYAGWSGYINQSTGYNCPSEEIEIGRNCYLNTSSRTCTENGSGWNRYRVNCKNHNYYSSNDEWSGYINKGTDYECPSSTLQVLRYCYLNTSSRTCTANGSGWNKYRVKCRKYDDVAPTCSVSGNPTSWQKTDATLSATCSDSGGSGCANPASQTATSNVTKTFTVTDGAGNTNTCSASVSKIDKVAPLCGTPTWNEESGWGKTRNMVLSSSSDALSGLSSSNNYTCNVSSEGGTCNETITDKAGNPKTCTSIAATRVDRTNPVVNWPNEYISANAGLEITVYDSLSGYDITTINADDEAFNTTNVNGFKLKVDSVTAGSNGYEDYDVRIKVCDNVGNCPNFSKTFHVYAGNITKESNQISGLSDYKKTKLVNTDTFISGNTVADGSEKTLTIQLRDKYGNEVIPVKKSNGTTVVRDVNLELSYNDNLYKDQILSNGNGVQIDGSDRDMLNAIRTYENDLDGNYEVKFAVYAPTINGNTFKINSVKGKVTDTNVETTLNSAIDFDFKPIYSTNIVGYSSGLVEGNTQTGILNVIKQPSATHSVDGLYLVQSGSTKAYFSGSTIVNDTGAGTMTNLLTSDASIGTQFLSSLGSLTKKIKTLFTLKEGGLIYRGY